MREFWFFSLKWWIMVLLWHEFWPMAAAGLHIQDQGRLFRMSSGVCQTIKVSEFFLYNILCTCKSSFFRDRGMMACLQILDHVGKRKMESGSILLVSHNIDPPFSFSIKSESRHYPSDGLISLCAVMQRETEYQIRFNINLSWKRCICMKQKTAFHDYSFSDKIFIAAHIRSWVSHMKLSSILCQILRVKFTPNFCVP